MAAAWDRDRLSTLSGSRSILSMRILGLRARISGSAMSARRGLRRRIQAASQWDTYEIHIESLWGAVPDARHGNRCCARRGNRGLSSRPARGPPEIDAWGDR